MNEWLTWLLDHIASISPFWRIPLAGLAIMLETSVLVGLIVPGDSVVLVAAAGVANWWEWGATLVAVIAGALVGESIGFALGRWFGPRIRASWFGRRIGEHNWRRAEIYLARRGGVAVFFSRFLPVLHSLVPLTVGMSKMRYRVFLAWTAAACTVWSLVYVTVGWRTAASYRELSSKLHNAGYLFVGVGLAFVLIMWGVKKLIARLEERHMRLAGEVEPETGDSVNGEVVGVENSEFVGVENSEFVGVEPETNTDERSASADQASTPSTTQRSE